VLSSAPAGSGPWTGDPLRQFLREELEGKVSPEASRIYWEAVRILDDASNPERHAICCYLLREVQNEFPNALLKRKVRPLGSSHVIDYAKQRWDEISTDRRWVSAAGRWQGQVVGALAKFLRKLGERIREYRGDHPRFRDEHLRAFMVLDPGLGEIDEKQQGDLLDAWNEFRRFFNGHLHHDAADPAACEQAVRSFETFVGNRLNPPTTANMEAIARLVREAEANANP
jgi:hypothetical protein